MPTRNRRQLAAASLAGMALAGAPLAIVLLALQFTGRTPASGGRLKNWTVRCPT